MLRTVFSTSDSPITIDDAGHTAPGREYSSIDVTTPQAQAALSSGALVLLDESDNGEDVSQEARAALERTAELNKPVEPPNKPARSKRAESEG